MAELTSFQWALVFVLLIAVIIVALVIVFWISRKYPSKKSTTADPFIKVIIIMGLLILIHIGLIAFGVLSKESLEKNIKYYFIAGIILLLIYLIIALFWKRPIPTYTLFHKYLVPEAKSLLGGELYKGTAYVDGFMWSMVIPAQLSEYMRESGIFNEKVEVFLFQMKHGNIFLVMGIRDKFTGEGLRLHKNPPTSLLNSYLGKEVTKSMTEQLKEFNKEDTQNADDTQ